MLHLLDKVSLTKRDNLQTLVENRSVYALDRCELNVFETNSKSFQVPLTFNDFVITSMLKGKKVMHLMDRVGFDYLPGQSVIVPPGVTMKIDFPEAADDNPTQCVALAIDHDQIKKTISYLNEFYPKNSGLDQWGLDYGQIHFDNNEEICNLINKIIRISTEMSKSKDILVDLSVKELLVRVMQTQNHLTLTLDKKLGNNKPLNYVTEYIKANLNQKISIKSLSDKACMSKATFYRLFKRELGMSPNDFILSEKINRAKQLLKYPGSKVMAVSFELGFTDANYFIKSFKKSVGITPGNYYLSEQQPH
jgi:AraC-like DNA-binding protein